MIDVGSIIIDNNNVMGIIIDVQNNVTNWDWIKVHWLTGGSGYERWKIINKRRLIETEGNNILYKLNWVVMGPL